MAVTEVTELIERRTANVGPKGERTYTRAFQIHCTSALNGPLEAVANIPVQRNDPYEEQNYSDLGALATEADADLLEPDRSYDWIVVVTYKSTLWDNVASAQASGGTGTTGKPPSSPHGQNPDSNSPENPIARPPKISVRSVVEKRIIEQDYTVPNPRAIINSAGDRFDPPYERDESIIVIVIERNESLTQFTQLTIEDNVDCINTYTIFGQNPGFVKCHSIEANSEYENGYYFWAVRYEFHIRRQGWNLQPLDIGSWYLVGGVPIPITVGGVPERRLLDGSGGKLAIGANPVFLDYQIYESVDFGLLNLPEIPR